MEKKHQEALEQVRPAHGGKAPHQGVEHHDAGGEEQGIAVIQTEGRVEQLAPGHEAGGSVDQEENENEEGGGNPQLPVLVGEPVVKVLRQGNGVAHDGGEDPQPLGHQHPVDPGADDQSQGNPEGADAGHVGVPRQAHEHPAAHVGSLRAHGRDPGTQRPSPQGVAFHILIFFIRDQPDPDQNGKIQDQSHHRA